MRNALPTMALFVKFSLVLSYKDIVIMNLLRRYRLAYLGLDSVLEILRVPVGYFIAELSVSQIKTPSLLVINNGGKGRKRKKRVQKKVTILDTLFSLTSLWPQA